MTDQAASADQPYEDWPFDQLRDAAFDRARHNRDLSFFVDLMAHTPALAATADEGGSLGEISGSLIETFEAAKQAFGDDPGEMEPLFRAVFATYLREHPDR
jgi:AcrR family transcriptional regulator